MNFEIEQKYDQTIIDLIKGELYEIYPQAKLFSINELNFNFVKRENVLFLFLEKFKIEPYWSLNVNPETDKIIEEYFATFLYKNKKYILKIEKNAKYFCQCT